MQIIKKEINSKARIISILFLFFFGNVMNAQVFWKEDFSSGGCTSKCKADTYSSSRGAWKVTSLGNEGADANDWFVSCSEEGEVKGQCQQAACSKNNGTLHISAATGNSIDQGASYTKGAAGKTDKRVESPTINCTGQTGIMLSFTFICFADSAVAGSYTDHCDLEYSIDNGSNWKVLEKNLISYACTNNAMWRLSQTVLPPDANNNPNVKIGFHWKNESTTGVDPGFAADDIELSTSSGISTGTITSPFCACDLVRVPFTSIGTFNAANIYTAELSDANGNFATPTIIGTLKSTANTETINTFLPCNIPSGTKYRIRVKSSDPPFVGTDNGTDIAINSPIKISIIPKPDTVCIGQKVVLKGDGGDPGAYQWSTEPIPTTADSLDLVVLKETSLILKGAKGGCVGADTVKIKVQAPPIVTVTNDTTCVGLPAVLKAKGASHYLWNTGSTLDSIVVTPVQDTFYVVTATTGKCSVKDTGYVKVFPSIAIAVNSAAICEGKDTILTATGALSYVWSTGATTPSIKVKPVTTTSYTVTGMAGACKGQAVATVTIKPKPSVSVTAPKSVCQGKSLSLKATGADQYLWLTPPNNATDTITIKPAASTTVQVIGIKDGCADTASVQITVDQKPKVVTTDVTICQGGTAVLNATGATTYYWPALKQSTDIVHVTPVSDTKYTVYGYNGDCVDSAFATVKVGPPVEVKVTSPKTTVFSCESTQLIADPSVGNFIWAVVGGGDDASIDCADCPIAVVTPIATQKYYVTYTSPIGCVGRDTIEITVIKNNLYFVATAFTPNGDGFNDVIQVHGKGIDHISFMIFDRIGEKVFETHQLEDAWDGFYRGTLMNEGVFVYKLEIYYCDGETVNETGNITLLK